MIPPSALRAFWFGQRGGETHAFVPAPRVRVTGQARRYQVANGHDGAVARRQVLSLQDAKWLAGRLARIVREFARIVVYESSAVIADVISARALGPKVACSRKASKVRAYMPTSR